MWLSHLIILPALALASYASTASVLLRTISQLLARQTIPDPSSIPRVCKSQCLVAAIFVGICHPPGQAADCGCSPNVELDLVICLNCALSLTPSHVDEAQNLLDQYVTMCNRAGVPLPATTVSGGTSLVTSTAARPLPSERLGGTGSTTNASAIASSTSPATTAPADSDNDDDFITTSPQSTITSPGSDSTGPVPINGEIKPKVKVWTATATTAGTALVVLL